LDVAHRSAPAPRTVALLVSLCTLLLVVVGLVWVTTRDEPSRLPNTDTNAPLPTAAATPLTTLPTEPSPTSPPTTPPVTPTTIPFDERPPMAIGESVMMGAAPQLAVGGFRVDAQESRSGIDIADLVLQLAADGELGRIVVLQVGTNGPVAADVYRRIADALADAQQVAFLTVHADRPWIASNNEIIWSLPAQYPNVTVLDWDGLVTNGTISGITSDGIHLGTPGAKQSYANYVFAAIERNDLVLPTTVSNLFVTVSDDRPAVIDLRDEAGVTASFDLGCPRARVCAVQSAHVMGEAIWVAINDTDPNDPNTTTASRVLSVSLVSGDVVEHLSLRGQNGVQSGAASAGRGVDGVVYAYLPYDRQLVALDNGKVTVLDTGVSGFLLSDDGRFLAVSSSDPPASGTSRITVTDLATGRTNTSDTGMVNAGPGAWSPDGRHLVVNEQWEDGTAWVVDPWTASAAPSPPNIFLDGACFINAGTIAHRTWNVDGVQGNAQTGVIRQTSADDGPATADLGEDLFGDRAIRCHTDGSVTYLRRPIIIVDRGGGFSQPEPDYTAPVDLIRVAPDGTATTITSGRLRMV